jgi:hypothetical protein
MEIDFLVHPDIKRKMMKSTIVVLLVLLSISSELYGQSRTIYGRVIAADDFLPIPGVWIKPTGKLLIGKTDNEGRFKISLPQHTQTLIFSWIGMEPATIKLNDDCDTVEVVMLGASTYDFMSSKKVDQLRLKQFNTLPNLHLQAYKKGLFAKQSVCYTREFEPEKPKLDSVEKEMVRTRKQIKLTFKNLAVGDTVRIPFSDAGGYRYDGTNRTTLTEYASYTGGRGHHSGCIISVVILSKNRHTRGLRFRYRNYNIVCKMVDFSGCKDPSVYDGKVMKPGVIFTYNMRYGEILGTQNFQ